MQKFSELEDEDDQWDDDFIFEDVVPPSHDTQQRHLTDHDLLEDIGQDWSEDTFLIRTHKRSLADDAKVELSSFLVNELQSRGLQFGDQQEEQLRHLGMDGLDLEDELNSDLPLRFPLRTAAEIDGFHLRSINSQNNHEQALDNRNSNSHEYDAKAITEVDPDKFILNELEEGCDWDNELAFESGSRTGGRPNYMELSQKMIQGMRAHFYPDSNAAASEKESMLEFLENEMRRHMNAHSFRERKTEQDLEQRVFCEEEDCPPSLRPLSSWILKASSIFHTQICRPSFNGPQSLPAIQSNDWTLRAQLIQALNDMDLNLVTIEEMLSICEQDPSKESVLFSISIVLRWCRGMVIEQHDVNIVQEKRRVANIGEHNMKPEFPTFHIKSLLPKLRNLIEQQLNIRCDQLFQSLPMIRQQVALIQSFISIPLLLQSHPLVTEKRLMEKLVTALGQFLELCRLFIYWIEIYHHFSSDELLCLDLIDHLWGKLDWLRTSFLPALVFFFPSSDNKYPISGSSGTSSITVDIESDTRMRIYHLVQDAQMKNNVHSLCFHTFRSLDGQRMISTATALQAQCLIDKFFLVSRQDLILQGPANRFSTAADSGLHIANKTYNCHYELTLGEQFVQMMVKLQQPNALRAKLSYAAGEYLLLLLNGKLRWQQKSDRCFVQKSFRLSDVSFDPKAVQLGEPQYYDVDEMESIILQAFSDALGPIEEAQSLLTFFFDAAMELFPFTAQPNSSTATLAQISPAHDHLLHSQSINQSFFSQASSATIASSGQNDDFVSFLPHALNCANILQPINEWIRGSSSPLLTIITQMELWTLTYRLFLLLVPLLEESLPHFALEIRRFIVLILEYLDLAIETRLHHCRDIFMSALRLGRPVVAVEFGKFLIAELTPRLTSNAVNPAAAVLQDGRVYEYMFISHHYAQQCMLMGRDYRAIRTLVLSLHLVHPYTLYHYELHVLFHDMLLLLSRAYYHVHEPERAIKVLHRQLLNLLRQPQSIELDQLKLRCLYTLAEAHYLLKDNRTCRKLIRLIRKVRSEQMDVLISRLHDSCDRLIVQFQSSALKSTSANHSSSSSGERSDSHTQLLELLGHRHRGLAGSEVAAKRKEMRKAMRTIFPRYALAWQCLQTRSSRGFFRSPIHENHGSTICPLNWHELDLSLLSTKICCQMRMFTPALKQLLPLIIAVELWIGSSRSTHHHRGDRHFLAQLYLLRATIELDACRASAEVRYPVELSNSSKFNTLIQTLSTLTLVMRQWLDHDHEEVLGDSSSFLSLDVKEQKRMIVKHCITWKRTIAFTSPSDLLMDAIRWFHKAWDLFQSVGDAVYAARAANQVANCHLFPLFIPMAFLGVPYDIARDLSNFDLLNVGDAISQANPPTSSAISNNAVEAKNVLGAFTTSSLPAGEREAAIPKTTPSANETTAPKYQASAISMINRQVSFEEISSASTCAFDICSEVGSPLDLLETYLIRSELYFLQGHVDDALTTWLECKELFIHMFVDGVLVPMLRCCSFDLLMHLRIIIHRMLCLFWKWDDTYRRKNLFLLDLHHLFHLEKSRLIRALTSKSALYSRLMNSLIKKFDREYEHGKKESKSQSSLAMIDTSPPGSPRTVRHEFYRPSPPSPRVPPCGQWLTRFFSLLFPGPLPPNHLRFSMTSSASQNRNASLDTSVGLALENNIVSTKSPATSPRHLHSWTILFDEQEVGSLVAIGNDEANDEEESVSQLLAVKVRDKVFDFGWKRFLKVKSASRPEALACPVSYADTVDSTSCSFLLPSNLQLQELSGQQQEYSETKGAGHNLPAFLTQFVLCRGDVEALDSLSLSSPAATPFSAQPAVHSPPLIDSGSASQLRISTPNIEASRATTNQESITESDRESFRPLDPICDFPFLPNPISNSRAEEHDEDSADQAEKILIHRLCNAFEYARGICDVYSHHYFQCIVSPLGRKRMSLSVLGKTVRSALTKHSQMMWQLRGFSRQYKFSLLEIDSLLELVRSLGGRSGHLLPPHCGHMLHRVAKVIHVCYMPHLLLAYHPFSGNTHVQPIGQGFYPFHYQRPSTSDAHQPLSPATQTVDFSPRSIHFTRDQLELVFDAAMAEHDHECGGGVEQRRATLQQLRSLVFPRFQAFVRQSFASLTSSTLYADLYLHCCHRVKEIGAAEKLCTNSWPSPPYPTISALSSLRKRSLDSSRAWEVEKDNLRGSTGSIPVHRGVSESNLVDVNGLQLTPATLLCSGSIAGLPWEVILGDRNGPGVLRRSSLIAMFAQLLDEPSMANRPAETMNNENLGMKIEANRLNEWWSPSPKPISEAPKHSSSLSVHINQSHPLHQLPSYSNPLHIVRGGLGPSWYQRPAFVCVDWDSNALPSKLIKEAVSRLQQRRMQLAIQQVSTLGQDYMKILRNERYRRILQPIGPRPAAKPAKPEKLPRTLSEKYSRLQTLIRDAIFPLPSVLAYQDPQPTLSRSPMIRLPLYTESQQPASPRSVPKLRDFSRQIDLQLREKHSKSLHSLAQTVLKKEGAASEEYYVIVLLSTADLLEMAEAMLFALHSHRRDMIVLFAPPFIQEKLWSELRRVLSVWATVVEDWLSNSQSQSRSRSSRHRVNTSFPRPTSSPVQRPLETETLGETSTALEEETEIFLAESLDFALPSLGSALHNLATASLSLSDEAAGLRSSSSRLKASLFFPDICSLRPAPSTLPPLPLPLPQMDALARKQLRNDDSRLSLDETTATNTHVNASRKPELSIDVDLNYLASASSHRKTKTAVQVDVPESDPDPSHSSSSGTGTVTVSDEVRTLLFSCQVNLGVQCIVLDVVSKLQEEHAVSIATFM